jgi:hypothetical protein
MTDLNRLRFLQRTVGFVSLVHKNKGRCTMSRDTKEQAHSVNVLLFFGVHSLYQ